MEKHVKLSVIIPVYNVKNYLYACLRSLLKNTSSLANEFEVILIDDGSTDESSHICNDFSGRYKNVITVHQTNQGQSSARNAALRIAKGEWISFVDSDDLVVYNYISILLSIANAADKRTDIIMFLYKNFEDNTKPININSHIFEKNKLNEISKTQAMYLITTEKYGNYFWNKLFRKCLFNDIKLPVGRKYEDIATLYKYLGLAKKILIYNDILYLYRQREGSTIHVDKDNRKKRIDLLSQSICARAEQLDFFKKQNYFLAYKNAAHYLMTDYVFYIVWTNKYKFLKNDIYYEAVNYIKRYKPNLTDGMIFYFFIVAFKISPRLIERIIENVKF